MVVKKSDDLLFLLSFSFLLYKSIINEIRADILKHSSLEKLFLSTFY